MTRFRSALPGSETGELIEVTAVAELLAGLLSGSVPLTLTVLEKSPPVVGVTTMVIYAVPLKAPTLQVTVPPEKEQLPRVLPAETKVTQVGNVSVTTTPVGVTVGPLLVTAIEEVRLPDARTSGSGES